MSISGTFLLSSTQSQRIKKTCKLLNGGGFLKKIRRNREEARLSLVRHEFIYLVIKEEHEIQHYPIRLLCQLGSISRAAYYKWVNQPETDNEKLNQQLSEMLEKLHKEHPDME